MQLDLPTPAPHPPSLVMCPSSIPTTKNVFVSIKKIAKCGKITSLI
jgi:hypothetical protein